MQQLGKTELCLWAFDGLAPFGLGHDFLSSSAAYCYLGQLQQQIKHSFSVPFQHKQFRRNFDFSNFDRKGNCDVFLEHGIPSCPRLNLTLGGRFRVLTFESSGRPNRWIYTLGEYCLDPLVSQCVDPCSWSAAHILPCIPLVHDHQSALKCHSCMAAIGHQWSESLTEASKKPSIHIIAVHVLHFLSTE